MASPAETIKSLFDTANVDEAGEWLLTVSRMPSSPDKVIAVYDAGGIAPNPQFKLDMPAVQVRVRGAKNGYSEAYAKIQDCVNAILGLPSQDIGGDRWVSVAMRGYIQPIGYDESERPELTANFSLIIEPSASSYREAL